MCGKFTQMASWREVHAFSQPLIAASADDTVITATPMRFANILHLKEDGERTVTSMRWGFSRSGAARASRPDHMHARAETAERLPTFAAAFARHRGILLVRTFNEGEELPGGRTRQWVISPINGEPVAIAVICEQRGQDPSGSWSFVQVTTPANTLISKITDRMPAVLARDNWQVWLGETGASLNDVKDLLKTYEDDGDWDMSPQTKPDRAPPRARPQPDLFGD